MVNEKLDFY